MKPFVLVLIYVLLSCNIYSQSTRVFDAYKYIYLPYLDPYYEGEFEHTISIEIADVFERKGFKVLSSKKEEVSFKDIELNHCLVLACEINIYPEEFFFGTELVFSNCTGRKIYKAEGGCPRIGLEYGGATSAKRALKEISKMNYKYDQIYTPKYQYPKVEKINMTLLSLMDYLVANEADQLEGVYETRERKNEPGYYKLGIKKFDVEYKAFIIETFHPQWKTGEVKATFKPGSLNKIFITNWYSRKKHLLNGVATLKGKDSLKIIVSLPESEDKLETNLIKTFPVSNVNSNINRDNLKYSRIGVVISTDGLVLTNSNTLKKETIFKVKLRNELGEMIFSAELIKVNEEKKLALVKIIDKAFTGFNNIPYRINADIKLNEEVYTITGILNHEGNDKIIPMEGTISYKPNSGEEYNFMRITPSKARPYGGGPLFNKKGEIVGYIPFSIEKDEELAYRTVFAIKPSSILEFLGQYYEESDYTLTPFSKDEILEQASTFKNYVCEIILKDPE